MNRYFSNFEIEKVDKIFKNSNTETQQTAIITLFDDKGESLKIEKGVITAETLYDKIDNNQSLIFDGVLIENFNLTKYKESRNLETKQHVKLKDVVLTNSFFVSYEQDTDFSTAEFLGEQTSFKHSVFVGHKSVSFANCIFHSDVYFEYSVFHFVDVYFHHSQFNKEIVSFKSSLFKGKSVKKFNNTVFDCNNVSFINTEFGTGDVYFGDSTFNDSLISFKVARFGKGKVDFGHTNFGNKLTSFEKVEFGDGSVNFRAAEFGTGNVDFIRCIFGKGDISFVAANFNDGDVVFTGTEFGDGKFSFKHAQFGQGKFDLHYTHFGTGDLVFERTNFMDGNVDFRAANFGTGKITFHKANFGMGEVIFEASELQNGKISFRKTTFGAGIFNFEMANFESSDIILDDINFGQGKISFKQSRVKSLSLQSSQINNYFDLRLEECKSLDLSNTIVKDIIDIDAADFASNIEALDLSGIRVLGRIYIDWRKYKVKDLILNQKTSWANKASQFRLLKENYNTIGQYDYEDEAYVEFKRAEAKSLLESSNNKDFKSRLRAKIKYWFQLLVFDKVGLYATDPIRVLFSMSVIFLIFTAIFILLQYITLDSAIMSSLFEAGDVRNLSLIEKAFYHSAITFLTIGYGDYYPTGISRGISALEGFLGLFLMSYFTVAFVRRILR